MEQTDLPPTLMVAALFERWPQTIPVFVRHRFACVGCLMAPFDTLADVARNYRCDLGDLQEELSAVIALGEE